MQELMDKASSLLELLPYLRQFSGKTFVIKCGGSVLTNKTQLQNIMHDISFLHGVGIRIVLVHGGGPEISQMCEQLGLKTQFSGGLRVTAADTVEIAQMVLLGKTNRNIITTLNQFGTKALGMSGQDASFIKVTQLDAKLGFVGKIHFVETALLETLLENNYLPVIAPLGVDEKGQSYNINADSVAGSLAAALHSEKLIILSDVNGIYENREDPTTRIESISASTVENWLEKKLVEDGMIPKLEACLLAIQHGVQHVHILDGKMPHSLLFDIFTQKGVGTKVIANNQ